MAVKQPHHRQKTPHIAYENPLLIPLQPVSGDNDPNHSEQAVQALTELFLVVMDVERAPDPAGQTNETSISDNNGGRIHL